MPLIIKLIPTTVKGITAGNNWNAYLGDPAPINLLKSEPHPTIIINELISLSKTDSNDTIFVFPEGILTGISGGGT